MDFFEEGFDGGAFGFGNGPGTDSRLLWLRHRVGVVEVRFRGRGGHGGGERAGAEAGDEMDGRVVWGWCWGGEI